MHFQLNLLDSSRYEKLMQWTQKRIKYTRIPSTVLDLATLKRLAPSISKDPISFCHFTRNIVSNIAFVDSHSFFLAETVEIEQEVR